MKKLLYIGHTYHNKTKSTQFLKDILSKKYEITQFDFDPYNDNFDKFKSLGGQIFDVILLFQIMPSINKLQQYVKCDKIVFFPMYDGVDRGFKTAIWSEYKDCIIINFSKTLHKKCKNAGLASFYIQYFPKPDEIVNIGAEKKVFLWQRTNQVTINTIEKTLKTKDIEQLYLHNAPDPEQQFIKPSKKWNGKYVISTWFDTKEQMNNYLQECAIYYAPRKYEGIGMSFLEAMAVGRCVIAPNYPTMNEYITNGINGYLYNYKHPRKIKINNVRKIQENTIQYIKDGFERWEQEKFKILDWIEADVQKYSDISKQNSKLQICNPKNYLIKIAVKKSTAVGSTYYLFGILPIFFKKRRKNK